MGRQECEFECPASGKGGNSNACGVLLEAGAALDLKTARGATPLA